MANDRASKAGAYNIEIPDSWEVSTNITDKALVISKSKMKLILINFKNSLVGSRDWISAVGLCLTFVAAIVTSDFQSVILPKEAWKTIFLIGAVLSLVGSYTELLLLSLSVIVER